MRVGFHVEGNDHLVLRVLVARLLDLREDEIESDPLPGQSRSGLGWQTILSTLPLALRRFYAT